MEMGRRRRRRERAWSNDLLEELSLKLTSLWLLRLRKGDVVSKKIATVKGWFKCKKGEGRTRGKS